MGLRQWLFNHLLAQARFIFVYVINFQSWEPFKRLEVATADGRKLVFSILHNRRRKSWYDVHVTYLIYVEVLQDDTKILTKISNKHLLTVDVPFGFMFNDRIVANTILNQYLDRMIEVLEYVNQTHP